MDGASISASKSVTLLGLEIPMNSLERGIAALDLVHDSIEASMLYDAILYVIDQMSDDMAEMQRLFKALHEQRSDTEAAS